MTKILTLLLIAVLLQSNSNLQKHLLSNNLQNGEKRIGKDTSVQLKTFTVIPNDVAGCVCYFYLTKADERKRVYIMVENFADRGYVSINGKIQRFNLISFKDMHYYFYSNGVYNMKVEFKNKVGSDSEDFRVTGVITLLKGKIVLARRNFIGECTC